MIKRKFNILLVGNVIFTVILSMAKLIPFLCIPGNAYYRYTRGNARVDGGYPRSITAWSNSLLGGVDAVSTAWGKSLFMSGSQYYEYNDANIKVRKHKVHCKYIS